MQPSIKRRTFVQLFTLPALVLLHPPAQFDPPLRAGLIYSDDTGTTPALLDVLRDGDPSSGIEYPA